MAKVKLGCSVGICKKEDVIEVDDELLEGLDEEGRNKLLDEELDAWLPNYLDCWASFVDD